MNIRVIALTIAAFVVGLVELIIGGILPQIADDLHITIAHAGLLITIFSIVFAISGPLLLTATSKIERKKLLLTALIVFFIGTVISFWGPNYFVLMLSRVVGAASGSLIIVLALTLSIKVVAPEYQARAIGLVSMGISSAIVIGIPIGVIVSDLWSWRIVFLIAAILTIISFIIVMLFIEHSPAGKVITLKEQWLAIKQIKIASAHTMIMFAIGGHYIIYAYLTPYLQQFYALTAGAISAVYFAFGFSAIAGGYLGGLLADKINPRRAIIVIISIFLVTLICISMTDNNLYTFIPLMIVWGCMSWAISPPQQAYLIATDPKTGDIQQSIHNSALQIGIAGGSALGGLLITCTDSVAMNTWAASIVMLIALCLAIFSITRKVST